jgi:hypothetical protein
MLRLLISSSNAIDWYFFNFFVCEFLKTFGWDWVDRLCGLTAFVGLRVVFDGTCFKL